MFYCMFYFTCDRSLTLSFSPQLVVISFYRAMHLSAKRRLSVACRPSVRPYVCLSVTLVNWIVIT